MKDRINGFIIESCMGIVPEDFDEDTSFMASGMLDSTGVMELVSFLEDSFSIKIEDRELVPDNLDSVNRIVGYLRKKGVSAAW